MDFLAGQGFDFNKFVYGVRSAEPPSLKQASDTSDSKHTHPVTLHGRHMSVPMRFHGCGMCYYICTCLTVCLLWLADEKSSAQHTWGNDGSPEQAKHRSESQLREVPVGVMATEARQNVSRVCHAGAVHRTTHLPSGQN